VTVVNREARILGRDDAAAAQLVERTMQRDGVRFLHSASVTRAEWRGGARALRIAQDGRAIELVGDTILVAVGRVPDVEGLGLELAGVRYDRSGVLVDDKLRTSNRRIFAAGDVCGAGDSGSRHYFTHAADAQARLAVCNALFFGIAGGKVSRLAMPWTTYTSPEIAHVGMPVKEVLARGAEIHTITFPLAQVDRAVLDGDDEGFLRVHLRAGSDRIVGGTLVAEHAGEMIGELALAITARVGLGRLARTIHPYPTQAEILRKAADAWYRSRLTAGRQRLLTRYFAFLS
jgi:pyruvate/2-oxoglutarate dehydrogenase complex dihydrolipoamide dehydrogenase (E3) component